MVSKKNLGDLLTNGLRYTAYFFSSVIGGLLFFIIIIIGISESIKNGLELEDSESIWMAIYIVGVPFGVIMAWWKEWIGGAILTIYCLVHIISYYLRFGVIETVSLIRFAPFLVSGVPFLIYWAADRARRPSDTTLNL